MERKMRNPLKGKPLRKKAEKILSGKRKSVRKAPAEDREFRAIFELSSVGMTVRDAPTGRRIRVNQRLCEMTGYSAEELLKENGVKLTHPDDRERNREIRSAVLKGECETWVIEKRYVRKNGEAIWVHVNGNLTRDSSGQPYRTVAVIQDITERKRTEKKLKDSERLYRAIGESIDYGIWVCDPEGRNIYASESFLNLVGITQDQCSEFGWGGVLHPEDAEGTVAAWKECARTGGKWDIEHRYRGADGKWHPILARGVPVRDEQGRVICWAGINLDISEIKQMEEDLRRSRDELEKRVQERTEELARSQQRLQQLASQLLLAQEKERKRVAVELHDGLLSELAATKYMLEERLMSLERGRILDPGGLRRVSDILGNAMKEARRIMNNLHPSVLDELGLIAAMNWLCGEFQKSYPHIAVRKRIGVSQQDISDSVRVVIYRVLQEALNNFAKHGKGNLVELSLLKSDDTFVLMIQDNGQGFDLENAPKGLGVESMRERVEISGGTFQIESVVGQGTKIRAIWSPLLTTAT